MKIAIGCIGIRLGRGGADRAASALANELVKRGHECILVSLFGKGHGDPQYPLDERIVLKQISVKGYHDELQSFRVYLIEQNVDVFLSIESSVYHLFWCNACIGTGIPFIFSERCEPQRLAAMWSKVSVDAVAHGADAIHTLLAVYAESIPEHLQSRVHVIPNAAPLHMLAEPVVRVANDRRILLFLARFEKLKNPELLVHAFKLLANEFPLWDLHMWGWGANAEEEALHKLVQNYKLEDRIFIKGEAKDVSPIYSQAHLYCLPSITEGMPNTVLEAFCHGLPVVGMACCEGVCGLIQENANGMLAQNATPESLVEALRPLMASQTLRNTMSANALATAQKHAPQIIFDQWEALFMELCKRKGKTVMDSFSQEPFSSQAVLSIAARQEWILREFGMSMPYSVAWWWERAKQCTHNSTQMLWNCIKKSANIF